MVTQKEIRQIVREEICLALPLALVPLAERIEKAISLTLSGNNNRSECISAPTDPLSQEVEVPRFSRKKM